MQRLLSSCLILLYVQLIAAYSFIHRPNMSEPREIIKNIFELRNTLKESSSPYIKITKVDTPLNCIQIQCRVMCTYGKAWEIESDIEKIMSTTQYYCNVLEELKLFNYIFPNNIIPVNFLGNYTNRIESLYIGNSLVTDYENGAFGNGIFQKITLENLKLDRLRRGFFKDIGPNINSITLIQKEIPVKIICESFLFDVRYKIKYLSLQIGISCISNLTASNDLFNKLAHVDFSYNALGNSLQRDAFNMLSRVEYLDLSHSKISYLPEFIFKQMEHGLEYLDLSYNLLKTISTSVFGWSTYPAEFKIYAHNNVWNCTCELKQEIEIIFGMQSSIISCQSPAEYFGWSVFDDRICEDGQNSVKKTTISTWLTSTTTTSTVGPSSNAPNNDGGGGYIQNISTTTSTHPFTTTASAPLTLINLQCKHQTDLKHSFLGIKRAALDFSVSSTTKSSVDVVLRGIGTLEKNFGLIWFSKVTKKYYKMEVNYNDYGFGCYGSISQWTTVKNLLPDVSYTFCLVYKHHLTVSPFNCKSVHLPGNLGVHYHAWLTQNLRATGISLSILGVVIFTFIGIAAIFIVLKNKPILLKGSKRVATPKGNNYDIIVLPNDRTLEELRQKEQMLAKRNSKCLVNLPQRRKSTDSTDSFQSYMNANLYEELPAYIKIDTDLSLYSSSNKIKEENNQNFNYIPASLTTSSTPNLVSYAEIPFRLKRTSNDPLPAVPDDEKDIETNLSAVNMLKTRTENSLCSFAFYDSSV